ncbi:MAG: CDP-alcohol phosphatidyltransferase [Bacteroidota bacterium]|nr:CDP-alcohol phosphatidyltransferase [Bacteroidota bacterium]
MENGLSKEVIETLSLISKGRHRTNILKNPEQKALSFLVRKVPSWVSSDMLTFLGLTGSIITMSGFILAAYINRFWLLIGILGFAINWLGDSLDGRLAYYRNKPHKWYGFSLDITIDSITIMMIGTGYIIYADYYEKWFGVGFVILYFQAIITALLQYKVTDKYSIDTGILGPTEARIFISLILIFEILVKGSIVYTAAVACIILLIVNIISIIELLKLAQNRDTVENNSKLREKQE